MNSESTDRRGTGGSDWDVVITPDRNWLDLGLVETWRHRELVWMLVRRDFVSVYKQTILGPLWFIIQPLLTTFAFVLLFSRIAKIPTGGVPPFIFYLTGIVIWTYFGSSLGKIAGTFLANAGIFSKVYFPRLVVPVSVAISNLMTLAIQLGLVTIVLILGGARLSIASALTALIATVPLVAYVGLLAIGVGIAISALTIRYRDLAQLVGFGIQLWMYVSPVAYPLGELPAKWQLFLSLNPMTAPIETFRFLVLGTGTVSAVSWAISTLVAIPLIVGGLRLFSYAERTSMDTV